jgi:tetratricopeptide (TPR) repeat protein
VRDELTSRPAVQARLLRALGDAYRGMGLYAAAEPLLQDAVTVYRSVGDSAALADALNSAGLMELERGRSTEAGPWLEEAVAIQRTLPVADPSRLGRMLSNLAATRQNANDVDRAIALYDEAEQLVGSAAVPDTGLLSIILNGRATMAQRAGDFEGAAAAAERILAIDRARLGESHPRIAIDLANIAFMHQRLGRIRQADSIQTASLDILRATVGTEHVLYFRALASLASIRAELGATGEARALFVESIAAMRRSMAESSELGITLSQYASLLAADGEPIAAEAAIGEAIAIERNANGADHPNVGILTTQLAKVRCTHDSDGALVHFHEALDILQRNLPPAHARVIDARRSLGGCLTSAGEFSEAENVLLAAFESVGGSTDGAVPGADLPRPAREVAAALADLYAAWQRPGEAAAYRAVADPQSTP